MKCSAMMKSCHYSILKPFQVVPAALLLHDGIFARPAGCLIMYTDQYAMYLVSLLLKCKPNFTAS